MTDSSGAPATPPARPGEPRAPHSTTAVVAASIRSFGIDVVTRLCERLIAGGVPSIHFYALNQSAVTLEICKRLQLV